MTVRTHGDFIVLPHWEIMPQYPTQSPYPDTELFNPCPILLMPSAWQGSDKYKSLSHWFDSIMVWIPWSTKPRDGCSTDSARLVPSRGELVLRWVCDYLNYTHNYPPGMRQTTSMSQRIYYTGHIEGWAPNIIIFCIQGGDYGAIRITLGRGKIEISIQFLSPKVHQAWWLNR